MMTGVYPQIQYFEPPSIRKVGRLVDKRVDCEMKRVKAGPRRLGVVETEWALESRSWQPLRPEAGLPCLSPFLM